MKAVIAMPEQSPLKQNAFARAVFALAQAHVNRRTPEEFVQRGDDDAYLIVQRAVQTPGSTGSNSALLQTSFRDYLVGLAPYSAAARLIAQAVPANANTANEVSYPVRSGSPSVPAWIGEGDAIPLRNNDFDLVPIGPVKKMAHILAWSRELAKRSDAESIFLRMMAEDVSAGLDAAFLATSAGSAIQPAGLLYNVSPLTPSGAGGKTAIESDLSLLAFAVATGGSGNATFIVAPQRLAQARILVPEIVANADIVASAAVPADRVIAVDGPSLLASVDPSPDIERATEGTLHMSDVPLEIVDDNGTVADPVRSLWQTASIALRVIHELDFVKRRSGAVAYMNSTNWELAA